jgi:DNA polymerase III delta subunit
MQVSIGKALRSIYKNGNKSSYFLLGDDYFLQSMFISKLKDYLKNNFETKYYYLNEINDNDSLFNNINSVSLFASNTISIIKNFNKVLVKDQSDLLEYIKKIDENNILVFVLDDYMIKNKFSKKISEITGLIDTRTPINNQKIKEWVNYYFKAEDIKIDNSLLDYLVNNFGNDISTIINEVEKYYLMNNNKEIASKAVHSDYQSMHIKTWHLLDVIGQKNLLKSINLYNNLHINGISSIPIIMQLYNFFMEMISINSGYSRLNKFLSSRLTGYKRNYTYDEIMNIIIALRDIDVLFKTSSINNQIVIDSLLVKICKGHYGK